MMECSSAYVRINCIRGKSSISFIVYSLLIANVILEPCYWRSIQCLDYFSSFSKVVNIAKKSSRCYANIKGKYFAESDFS